VNIFYQLNDPQIPKFNNYLVEAGEKMGKMFDILLLLMDDFYLNDEGLDIAKAIINKTETKMLFSDINEMTSCSLKYEVLEVLDLSILVFLTTESKH
jgi:hypothetical protein